MAAGVQSGGRFYCQRGSRTKFWPDLYTPDLTVEHGGGLPVIAGGVVRSAGAAPPVEVEGVGAGRERNEVRIQEGRLLGGVRQARRSSSNCALLLAFQ